MTGVSELKMLKRSRRRAGRLIMKVVKDMKKKFLHELHVLHGETGPFHARDGYGQAGSVAIEGEGAGL
jgi:hypothetical protein